jgi:hypothetical protein
MGAQVMVRLALVLLTLAACGDRQRDDFESLASQVNPSLQRLRPHFEQLMSVPSDNIDLTIQLCTQQDEDLKVLQSAVHIPIPGPRDKAAVTISWYPKRLLWDRRTFCGSSLEEQTRRREECAAWCRESWRGLANDVEVLRLAARRSGVDLASMIQ